MKTIIKLLTVSLLLYTVTACSSDLPIIENSISQVESIENNTRSIDDIIAIASAYGKTKGSQSRSGSWTVSRSSVIPIVKGRTRNVNDTLIYAVNFPEQNGYLIISANKSTEPILAMVDNGSFDNSRLEQNEGLDYFISCANDYVMNQRVRPVDSIRTLIPGEDDELRMEKYCDTIKNVSVSGPRLKVNWNQCWPENMYCPNRIAGCGPVAIAQVLTYFKPYLNLTLNFDEKPCNTLEMNWEHLLTHTQSTFFRYPTQEMIDGHIAECSKNYGWHHQIGALVRQIGVWCNSTYNENSTSTSSSAMWRTCNDILREQSKTHVNSTGFYNGLKDGGIALAVGFSGQGGHAWVMDGIGTVEYYCWTYYCYDPVSKSYESKDLKVVSSKYVHCNWGWGGIDNGYFLEGVYDTDKGVEYPTRYDFRYAVEGYIYK